MNRRDRLFVVDALRELAAQRRDNTPTTYELAATAAQFSSDATRLDDLADELERGDA